MTWPQVKLNEAYWFQEGPGVRKWQFTTSGIKLLNVGNITKDRTIDLSKTDRHLSLEEVEKKYSHFLADEGDLVIASSGISIDYDGFLRTRGAFIRQEHLPLCMNTSTIRFKGTEGVSELGFLRHWLDSFEFRSQISREVTGIAQKNFGPSHLKRIQIALPPLEEQKRIAGILDAADALRAKRREALAKLDDLLQSTFLDMFGDPVTNPKGWEVKNLGELGTLDRGVSKHRPRNEPALLGGDHPLIQTGEVANSGGYIRDYKSTYSDLGLKQSKMWPKGTLCITIAANIASTGILTFDACFPDSVVGFKSEQKGRVEFIQGLFWFLKAIIERSAPQVAQKNINLKILRELPVPNPPLDLQQRFAEIVSSVEEQKAKMRKHLEQLDDLFASLQQRAFRGDL